MIDEQLSGSGWSGSEGSLLARVDRRTIEISRQRRALKLEGIDFALQGWVCNGLPRSVRNGRGVAVRYREVIDRGNNGCL